jgi:predicted helicase
LHAPQLCCGVRRRSLTSDLLKDYKNGLIEKKLNLDDDFIKFIRWAQWRIKLTGYGILAFITNNTYLDGITHRKMRQSLQDSFDEIYILNLHGSIMKKDRCPDGSRDENVFDIQQGVSIGIFIKASRTSCNANVYHADLYGLRENKYNYLMNESIISTQWTKLDPLPEHYFFVPKSMGDGDYKEFYEISDIFGISSSGIQTKRDKIAVNLSRDNLLAIINDFAKMNADDIRLKFDLPKDGRDWKIKWASEHAAEILKKSDGISQILYRPFDVRWTIIDNKVKGLVAYPRFEVMQHMQKENLGLILTRQLSLHKFQHVSVTRNPIDGNTISLQTREYNYLFPLYLNIPAINESSYQKRFETMQFQADRISRRIPNLNPDFVSAFASRLGLNFVSDGHGDLSTTFGPEDIFDYIYAVFHSPTYRQRYAEFLKIDFPRVPMTSSPDLFRKLCILGEELVALHLLESPYLSQLITRYPVVGDNIVEKGFPKFVAYEEGAPGYVYINKAQYFEGVPRAVWEFHVGGYQVCEKWLKDRRGRQLSFDDLMHYQKVVVALKETIRLMAEIDRAIPGWPIE